MKISDVDDQSFLLPSRTPPHPLPPFSFALSLGLQAAGHAGVGHRCLLSTQTWSDLFCFATCPFIKPVVGQSPVLLLGRQMIVVVAKVFIFYI